MRLFNVGAFLAREPFDGGAVEAFEQTHRAGPFRIFGPAGGAEWGWFDFVRTPAAVDGGYHAIRPAVRRLLVPGFEQRVLPVLRGPTERSEKAGAPVLVDEAGGASAAWTGKNRSEWVDTLRGTVPDGTVESTVRSVSRGRHWYAAEVDAAGGGERLMLKVNYFPFWEATVDGDPVAIDHVAPNFMAVDVPAGRHRVKFTYRNPWWQKAGLVLSVLTLLGWSLWRWRVTATS